MARSLFGHVEAETNEITKNGHRAKRGNSALLGSIGRAAPLLCWTAQTTGRRASSFPRPLSRAACPGHCRNWPDDPRHRASLGQACRIPHRMTAALPAFRRVQAVCSLAQTGTFAHRRRRARDVSGVGINYAVQDAVVAANVLTGPLKAGRVAESDLAKVSGSASGPCASFNAFR